MKPLVLATGAIVAALALAATGASGFLPVGQSHACPTHHVQVLRAAGSVRIIVDVGHPHLGVRSIVLCRGHGHGVVLGGRLVQADDQNDRVLAVLVTGNYGALVQNEFASDGDGQVDVVVGNALTHHVAVRTGGSTDPSGVLGTVLAANGTVAWIDGAGVLHGASPGGPADGCVFDHGPVTATSLHRTGGTAHWLDGTTPHSAALSPASCVP